MLTESFKDDIVEQLREDAEPLSIDAQHTFMMPVSILNDILLDQTEIEVVPSTVPQSSIEIIRHYFPFSQHNDIINLQTLAPPISATKFKDNEVYRYNEMQWTPKRGIWALVNRNAKAAPKPKDLSNVESSLSTENLSTEEVLDCFSDKRDMAVLRGFQILGRISSPFKTHISSQRWSRSYHLRDHEGSDIWSKLRSLHEADSSFDRLHTPHVREDIKQDANGNWYEVDPDEYIPIEENVIGYMDDRYSGKTFQEAYEYVQDQSSQVGEVMLGRGSYAMGKDSICVGYNSIGTAV